MSASAPRSRSDILDALADVAERLGGEARDTLLLEHPDKHVRELRLLDRLLPQGGRVLDVGGGLGVNLACLARLRPDVSSTLVDRFAEYGEDNRMGPSERALPLLRERGVEVHALDFWPSARLPFADGAFDAATLLDVVEHLPGSPLALLQEIHRVLRPGGRLVLSGPNAAKLTSRLKLLAGRHPHIPFDAWVHGPYYSHYREYTPAEYRALVERAGYRVESLERTLGPWASRARKLYWRRRRSVASPVTWAVWGVALVQLLLPAARDEVYCVAVRAARP
ncbi:MAG: class I SAM-dependent methyltransferase [Longimicrobiales bacterium]